MTKYNLTDTSIKLGELNIDKSQFDLPKRAVVLSARINYKHETINGESVSTDEISKISCQIHDYDKVKILKESNISVDDLKSITLEILENFERVSIIVKNDDLTGKTIEIINPQVRLMWNMSRRGWSGVKLVASDIKIVRE